MFARFTKSPMFVDPKAPHRESANENKRLRPTGDSYVWVGRSDFPIRTWGADGFHANPYTSSLIPGQKAKVTIVVRDLVDRFGSLEFEGTILVTRVDSFGLHAR